MEISLVRHSISLSNGAGLISGAGADVALSDAGITYAELVRDAYDWQQFDRIYVSPMKRAKQTAALLTMARQPMTEDARLQEMDFGDWEGQQAADLKRDFPAAFDYQEMFSEAMPDLSPNAETYAHLLDRTAAFLADAEAATPAGKVLVVCHGFTIRALLANLLHTDFYHFAPVSNVSLTRLHLDEHDDFRARLEQFNVSLA
ncbi:histidine phosphatase family protein [Lacticaseibacillus yichunensis]|uniref:Histidine phosphatase family protein n=1 Tax=Lacticaseibacillus yichunensis TaxID=2486015 RepID=A0ABW4CS35_9LACO|nr:histidine phosphatase family protein [Lacticaseibacillus yichunensis]